MWVSIRDIANKFRTTRATVICMVKHKLLPKPRRLAIDNRGLHWNKDDLELFLFNNAKHAINEDTNQ